MELEKQINNIEQTNNSKIDKNTLIYFGIFSGVFILVAVFSALISSVRIGEHPFNTVHLGTSVAISLLFELYTYLYVRKEGTTKYKTIFSSIVFLATFILYIIFGSASVPLWLLGPMVLSCTMDISYGLFLGYYFLLQQHHYFGSSFNGLIVLFVLLTVLCLASYFAGIYLLERDENGMINFKLKKIEKKVQPERTEKGIAYLETFASELADKASEDNFINTDSIMNKTADVNETKEPAKDLAERVEEPEQKVVTEPIVETPGDYSEYISENSSLLDSLKTVKRNAYIHSLRVSVLATECAKALNYDQNFAKAIALYHEIGKIREGNTYENTLNILLENNFPSEIITAVEEVTGKKNDMFTSKEAGVVAISDTIITTYLYLKGTGSNIAPQKIIDSAMTKYMLNGRLDKAGVTIKDCGEIKNYFIDVLNDLENGTK